jgi:hypothetical protein
MADFRTHLAAGAVLGLAGSIAALELGLADLAASTAVLVFLPALIGSVAPDIDSDSSVPFNLTFGVLSAVAGLVVAYFASMLMSGDWLRIGVWALGAMLTFWFGVGTLFKKYTKHRGMAHSIPASVLGALVIFVVATRFQLPDGSAFLAGSFFGLGYLLHLILDEVYAAVDFEGHRLACKNSLGSALKLSSNRPTITAAVYMAVIMLTLSQWTHLQPAATSVFKLIW